MHSTYHMGTRSTSEVEDGTQHLVGDLLILALSCYSSRRAGPQKFSVARFFSKRAKTNSTALRSIQIDAHPAFMRLLKDSFTTWPER